MWIETTRFTSNDSPLPRKLYDEVGDYYIEFADTGRANVPEDVAMRVTKKYQTIEIVNKGEDNE